MKYTVRFAHLSLVDVKIGQKLKNGDKIGTMGNTGVSVSETKSSSKKAGSHLHIDCVRGEHAERYSLYDMEAEKISPDVVQLNYFIDANLFKNKFRITTYYADPEYTKQFQKLHLAYDIIPESGDWSIFWNRTKAGKVTNILINDAGYGNCVMVTYEVEDK